MGLVCMDGSVAAVLLVRKSDIITEISLFFLFFFWLNFRDLAKRNFKMAKSMYMVFFFFGFGFLVATFLLQLFLEYGQISLFDSSNCSPQKCERIFKLYKLKKKNFHILFIAKFD